MDISRRQFLKMAGGCVAGGTIMFAGARPFLGGEAAAALNLNFTITDALKDMVTHNSINRAQCYFWVYKEASFPAEVPGPNIFTTVGVPVNISLTNALDEPHAFFIPGVAGADSGPIGPGQSTAFSFTPTQAGTYLYYDNLNEPVNRSMGLHGALVVMPDVAAPGHKFTPYSAPTPSVQQLFDDFGTAAHFPGLSWEQGDPTTDTPAFRQYIWLIHEASSCLFAEVGAYTPGLDFPAADFVNAMMNDSFTPNGLSRKPEFFTISGQSGHFSHNNPFICPNNRVGEPVVVRILNAGVMTRSLHLHANHFYQTGKNGVVSQNPLWLDVYTIEPLDTLEYVLPYMRPPDIPNTRGIGLPDTPLTCIANPNIPGSQPHPVWPPTEELNMFLPALGTVSGTTPIAVQLSPLCYPMHDHSETSQTAQGGNYNNGMISGMNFTGDRNTAGGVATFPNTPSVHGPGETGPAAGP